MKSIVQNNINLIYIISFVTSIILSIVFTPFVIKLATGLGVIDEPKERGIHKEPKPLAGGIAIVASFVITSVIFVPHTDGYIPYKFIGIIVAGLFIAVVGFLDDMYQLSARVRIVAQVTAALIVIFTGTRIELVTWIFSDVGVIQLGALGNVLTVFWIVGLTNALNLIDGLDGLAAGLASIASISFMIISLLFGLPASVVLAAILAGACLGFLPLNFNPAKIFMGDTGSTFLGFMLAVLSIQGFTKSYTLITLVVGLLILGLPIFDTSFAILRRVVNKQSIAKADRGHIHHRLVDKGIGHKKAVLTMYLIAASLGIAGILLAMKDFVFAIIIMLALAITIIVDTIISKKKNDS